MEFNGNSFMEELLSLRRENWETNFHAETDDFLLDTWNFDCFYPSPDFILPNYSLQEAAAAAAASNNNQHDHGFAFGHFDTLVQEDNPLMVEENETTCKVEPVQVTETPAPLDTGLCLERRNRVKKIDGKPSKNLMAERRRRKRLNDRLSMLRSIVPKISKMDRTSILGDTIDYMKELLERIKNFEEEIAVDSDALNLMGMFKELKPNEILVRNTPKFDVERGNTDTRIEVCCAGKPNLLLSTMTTLEALGLEIQQCVISCFNDFAMQASCSEDLERRLSISSEEIKEALFRNAGYGGRCL